MSSGYRGLKRLQLQFPRWQIITAFDIITEASLAAVSLFLVAGIQMPVIGKIVVVSAFSSRLLSVSLFFQFADIESDHHDTSQKSNCSFF